jgi:hypothetical protein
MESIATDSTRLTRKRSSSPWIWFKLYYHKEHSQAEISKLLEKAAFELMEVAAPYLPRLLKPTSAHSNNLIRYTNLDFLHFFSKVQCVPLKLF